MTCLKQIFLGTTQFGGAQKISGEGLPPRLQACVHQINPNGMRANNHPRDRLSRGVKSYRHTRVAVASGGAVVPGPSI